MYSCRTNVIKLMSIDGYRCVGVMFGNPLPRWGVFHQWLVTEWCGCPALPRSLRRVGLGNCWFQYPSPCVRVSVVKAHFLCALFAPSHPSRSKIFSYSRFTIPTRNAGLAFSAVSIS